MTTHQRRHPSSWSITRPRSPLLLVPTWPNRHNPSSLAGSVRMPPCRNQCDTGCQPGQPAGGDGGSINYMALHGEQGNFASLFPNHGLGNAALMDSLTAFNPIVSGTIYSLCLQHYFCRGSIRLYCCCALYLLPTGSPLADWHRQEAAIMGTVINVELWHDDARQAGCTDSCGHAGNAPHRQADEHLQAGQRTLAGQRHCPPLPRSPSARNCLCSSGALWRTRQLPRGAFDITYASAGNTMTTAMAGLTQRRSSLPRRCLRSTITTSGWMKKPGPWPSHSPASTSIWAA